MRKFELSSMVKGWFVGDFSPTALQTEQCEVSVRAYTKGQQEPSHHHKVATEVTLVISGHVAMAGIEVRAGEGVVLEPNDASAFEALEDSLLCIVKVPSVKGDKYEP